MANDTKDLSISLLSPEDTDDVLSLENACFNDPWSREAFERAAVSSSSPVYVLRAGGKVAAYLAVITAADEGEIGRIAVEPDCRGRGYGIMLLEHAFEEGRTAGIRSWFLEVREHNTAALALYKKAGFVPVGRRPGYYRDPDEDGIIMKREEGHYA
ncbi:MAG: ribosomal protein S18-alanine N-acetyltransferase [Lachnospiraceae bacterium]|nr:ribosomal protein S18-alanine N-acetyltransferase [Lachnospiraceae bacterium]